MNADSAQLLLHAEVSLLFKDKASKRVYDFHEKLALFFTEKGKMYLKNIQPR
jgi:hypothetical protein